METPKRPPTHTIAAMSGNLARCASLLAALAATASCRQIAGLQELPKPCADVLMIDDMEDGDDYICETAGRHGPWFTIGDGSGTLEPVAASKFVPADIPGGRGQSHKAAHMRGSGFTGWGAQMGFNLDLVNLVAEPYNTGDVSGLKFWMKSNARVVKLFVKTEATTPASRGGPCMDTAETFNCDNDFAFPMTVPDPDHWVEYEVPYSALLQGFISTDSDENLIAGSSVFSPAQITTITFGVQGPDPFDVWIDDVSFDYCASCLPTCPDPASPVSCPAADGMPAGCAPPGTDCSKVTPALHSILNGVSGSSGSDLWAAGWSPRGKSAIVLHWDGTRWSDVPTNVTTSLNSVWVAAPGDVWTVGDFGVAQHWDGAAWTDTPTGLAVPLMSAWGSAPHDVWAVGSGGNVLHWDGEIWSPSASGTGQFLERVWGIADDDVWVVGDGGTILHWNGTGWATLTSGVSADLMGVWGSSRDDVWAVGGDGVTGTILHWDGTSWSPTGDATTKSLLSIWGSGADDVWAVGYGNGLDGLILHWDGSGWTTVGGAGTPTVSVWGTGPNDVWSVGNRGIFSTIRHWDGVAWSLADSAHMP
jgi:hypothetical protein